MSQVCNHRVKPVRPTRDPKTMRWVYGPAICSKCGEDLGTYCTQEMSSVCPGHNMGETLPYDACVSCTAPKPCEESP